MVKSMSVCVFLGVQETEINEKGNICGDKSPSVILETWDCVSYHTSNVILTPPTSEGVFLLENKTFRVRGLGADEKGAMYVHRTATQLRAS